MDAIAGNDSSVHLVWRDSRYGKSHISSDEQNSLWYQRGRNCGRQWDAPVCINRDIVERCRLIERGQEMHVFVGSTLRDFRSVDNGADWTEQPSLIPLDDSIAIRCNAQRFDLLDSESTLVVAYCGYANRHLPGQSKMEIWVARVRNGRIATKRFLGRFPGDPKSQDIRVVRDRGELFVLCTANTMATRRTTGSDGSEAMSAREKGGLMLFRSHDGGILWTGPQCLEPPPGSAEWANVGEVCPLSIDGRPFAVFNSIGRLHTVAITDTGWGAHRWFRAAQASEADNMSPGSVTGVSVGRNLLLAWLGPAEVYIARAALRGDSLEVDSVGIAANPGMAPTGMRIVPCGQRAAVFCSGEYRSHKGSDPSARTGIFYSFVRGR